MALPPTVAVLPWLPLKRDEIAGTNEGNSRDHTFKPEKPILIRQAFIQNVNSGGNDIAFQQRDYQYAKPGLL